jgi:hypothetical protein
MGPLVTTTSIPQTASFGPATTSTSSPSDSLISSANVRATSGWVSYAITFSIGNTHDNASRLLRPWTPQARMPAVRLSFRARYLAATAVAAPVRFAVIQVASMTASGMPVSGSFRINKPEM